jgi:TetR/AcrR family transcriptional repressor of bet genes
MSRLAGLVRASVTPPMADGRTRVDLGRLHRRGSLRPVMAEVHREGYQAFRDLIERLVGEVDGRTGNLARKQQVLQQAIVINALLDGLWIEISMGGDDFLKTRRGADRA